MPTNFCRGHEGIDIELICASGGTMLYTCFNLPFTQDNEKNDNLANGNCILWQIATKK